MVVKTKKAKKTIRKSKGKDIVTIRIDGSAKALLPAIKLALKGKNRIMCDPQPSGYLCGQFGAV